MLKELIKGKSTDNGYVVPVLKEQVLIDNAKDSADRRRDVFHPSDISREKYFCPRRWVLGARNPELYKNDKINAQTAFRFMVGHQLHDMTQRILGNAGVLFGTWNCRTCGHRVTGFKPDYKCAECGDSRWKYQEVPVIDNELHIAGHTDGIVFLPEGKFIFEYKTSNHERYSSIIDAYEHHKKQALWYLDIKNRTRLDTALKVSKYQDVSPEVVSKIEQPYDGVIVVYHDKNEQVHKEFIGKNDHKVLGKSKQFKVFSANDYKDDIDEMKETLRETYAHYENGTLPEKTCKYKSKGKARYCVAKGKCFEEADE
jgi:hypothetical protein